MSDSRQQHRARERAERKGATPTRLPSPAASGRSATAQRRHCSI